MTFPDKFSEAGKQQLASQLAFFQTLTSRAFENAERILALNLQATRATLDQTSGAVRQLAAVRDPRDLLALGAHSQQQVETAMAYSRKLFEIASKPAPVAQPASQPAPAPEEHIVTATPVMVNEPVAETREEPVAAPVAEAAAEAVTEPMAAMEAEPEPAPSAIAPSVHPLGEADPEPAPAVAADMTPIAAAVSQVAPPPAEALHPAASPIPDAAPIAIASVDPVDAVPPVAAKRSGGAAKGGRKR